MFGEFVEEHHRGEDHALGVRNRVAGLAGELPAGGVPGSDDGGGNSGEAVGEPGPYRLVPLREFVR